LYCPFQLPFSLEASFEPSRVGGSGLYNGSLKDLYCPQEYCRTLHIFIKDVGTKGGGKITNGVLVSLCIKPILIARKKNIYRMFHN
jgi:hypothetical protein